MTKTPDRSEPPPAARALLAICLAGLFATSVAAAGSAPAGGAAPPANPGAPPAGAGNRPGDLPAQAGPNAAASPAFQPLDLPDWVILDRKADVRGLPWILVVDDAQCPYCMQLHLVLEKLREQGDPEIGRATIATIPFPLAFHDQAFHIVEDAFCLEQSGKTMPWSAASYLDWLIVASWRVEPGWKAASIEDLTKDGGLFDSRYDAHKVTSSERRKFQTEAARAESPCAPGGCRGDAECEALCETARACRAECDAPSDAGKGQAGPAGAAPPSAGDKCLSGCADQFVSKRYRQFSKAHIACLAAEGPGSAHARAAAAYEWAVSHKVPGTPTVYVGHPSIGFRAIGDSDDMAGFVGLLREALAGARSGMKAAPAR